MLWNTMGVDMRVETLLESADICSWMYIRNVSLVQRPIFLMVACGTPLRYIAMAPPARRLWDPTSAGVRPLRSSPSATTACLTAVFISVALTSRGYLESRVGKYVLMHVCGSRVWGKMDLMRRMIARMGQ